MKKCVLFLFAAAVLSSMAAAQIIIENPAQPLSRNAGRIVTLKEEMRIEDTGAGFFFKAPRGICVSPKGDIFIKDGRDQALQFDPKGRFVRNLFKKGQGPGELTALLDIWASPDSIFLLGQPLKILVFDYKGNLVRELSLREASWGRIILADSANLLLQKIGLPDPSSGTGFIDLPQDIAEIAQDGASFKTIGSFPIRASIEVQEGRIMSVATWNHLQAVALDGNTLFLNYTPEYQVEYFARDEGAVVRVVDGKLWVQTSTVVAGKGILFDVYDAEGRYLDNFFIQLLRKDLSNNLVNTSLTVVGGFVYFWDKTEDELIVIKKCRLVGL